MINEVVAIKNVGCFRNSRNDVPFQKLTLIHGNNGRGKTTFCAILRSLQSNRRELVIERKTLPVENDLSPFVHIRLNGRDYKFANNQWIYPNRAIDATYPDIAIFDSTFVDENIHSGSFVEPSHEKNLYRVIVGKKGVELASKIEYINEQIRETVNEQRAKEAVVKEYTPDGIGVKEYMQVKKEADIDEKIQQKAEELAIANKSGEIRSNALLETIQIPSSPDNFQMVIGKALEDISADAHERVRSHISNHEMENHGESWLSQGLEYTEGTNSEVCPFCGQSLDSNELLEVYKDYFNAAYSDFKREVDQLARQIDAEIGEGSLFSAQFAILENRHLFDFWTRTISETIQVSLPAISFQDIQQKYTNLREQCLALVLQKQNNLIGSISMDLQFGAAVNDVEALQNSVSDYNEVVKQINKHIMDKKAAARNESDASAIQKELEHLKATKKRFDPEVVQACNDYQAALKEKDRLQGEKEAVRRELSEHDEKIFPRYQKSINEHLQRFGTGFRIKKSQRSDRGKTRSFQYCLEINNTIFDLGRSRTTLGPSFKNTLSSGDKSALALAFFLAALERDDSIQRKVVIFDDPFTSLDRFRITETKRHIRKLQAEQVIVLSHDKNFLKMLWDEYAFQNENRKNQDRKALRMAGASNNMIIREWDIEDDTQINYNKNCSKLKAFSEYGKGDAEDVVKTIRLVLEERLKQLFPLFYQESRQMGLGEMIGSLRDSDAGQDLFGSEENFKRFVEEVTDINEYSRDYHHPNLESVDEAELESYVKRTMKLAGGA
ncbi:MAG: AAA family ATPase [Deltaproteobacteria bacterium]|nr:AAA family ATPase [Deltaproteobacteria bacterium]